MRRAVLLLCLLAVVAAACGGTPATAPLSAAPTEAATPVPTAPFTGQVIELVGKQNLFSIRTVTVKAGEDFEVRLVNQDEINKHAVYVTEGVRPIEMKSLDEFAAMDFPFKGEYVQPGQEITYHVTGLPAGAYQFFCPPHRDMVVSVTVQ